MRLIVACLLLMGSMAVYSSEITCFSGKTRIYHGFVKNIRISDDFIAFTELKTKDTIMTNSDCVIIR